MSNNEVLEGFYESFKKKSKLNNEEKSNVKKVLYSVLNCDETDGDVFNYFILFPEQLGVDSIVEYLKDEKKNKNSIDVIKKFLNCSEFNLNRGGRSISRGTYLLGRLYKERLFSESKILLKEIIKLSLSNKSKKITNKSIEIFRKNLVNNYYTNVLFIRADNMDDEFFYKFENVILKIIFKDIEGKRCINRAQLKLLNWLASSERKIILAKEDRLEINNAIKSWPIELIGAAKNNEQIISKFGSQLNFTFDKDSLNSINENKSDDEKDVEINNNEEKKDNRLSNKEEAKAEDIVKLLQLSLDKAKRIVVNERFLEKKLEDILELQKLTEKNYEEKLNEVRRKEKTISELSEKMAILERTNENLGNKVKILSELNTKLSEDIKNRDKQLDTILQIDNKEENLQINEFKNKLSSKLRYLYIDFKDAENLPMSIDFGENLRLQMNEIFDILIRSDIKL